uniref:Uncharacterized protein n=1 Tax=Oryza nivara TaxID=4536 RepID=A0A0E0GE91_ORYNI
MKLFPCCIWGFFFLPRLRVNDPIALELLSKSGEIFHYIMNKKNLVCWWPRRPNNRAIFEG